MLNRRGALMGLLGGTASGPSVIKGALGAGKVSALAKAASEVPMDDFATCKVACEPRSELARKACDLIWKRHHRREERGYLHGRVTRGECDFNISHKKSWSPAFKTHLAQQQSDEDQMIRDLTDGKMSDALAIKIISLLTS